MGPYSRARRLYTSTFVIIGPHEFKARRCLLFRSLQAVYESPMAHSVAASSGEAPAFHVFSVRNNHLLGAEPNPVQDTKDYVTRRTHRKSRAGCTTCKIKRVKCDEKTPTCSRCLRNYTHCNYDKITSKASKEPAFTVTVLDGICPAAQDLSAPSLSVPKTLIRSSNDLHLLKHFDTLSNEALLIGPAAEGYHNAILRLAQSVSDEY